MPCLLFRWLNEDLLTGRPTLTQQVHAARTSETRPIGAAR